MSQTLTFRRSARVRKAVPIYREDSKVDLEDGIHSQEDDVFPPKKKRKTVRVSTTPDIDYDPSTKESTPPKSKTKSKKKEKKLDILLTMPMDVICEVMAKLSPLDLLRMTRTSKSMRAFFLSPSSKPLWVAARKGDVRLPECPDDMSEPAYASLCYEFHCQQCGKKGINNVSYALRMRLCRPCRALATCRPYQKRKILRTLGICQEDFWKMLPSAGGSWAMQTNTRADYREREFLEVLREFQTKKGVERNNYVANRQKYARACMEHGMALNSWYMKRQATHYEDRQAIVKQRQDAIYARLKSVGWNDDDMPNRDGTGFGHPYSWVDPHYQEWHRLNYEAREIKPTTWTTLLPKLEDCLRGLKQSRTNAAGGNTD